jgi:PhnB protein
MSTLNPYLSFKDNAREAMEFYKDVFGGELVVSTFGEYGGSDDPGAPPDDGVMHAQLTTPSEFTLMGADTPPGMEFIPGTNIAISLSGGTEESEELRGYWEKLSDGGTVGVALEKQMWGDEFGMVVDRFGIGWMVNIAAAQED